MSSHKKLAAATFVLTLGVGGALLFPRADSSGKDLAGDDEQATARQPMPRGGAQPDAATEAPPAHPLVVSPRMGGLLPIRSSRAQTEPARTMSGPSSADANTPEAVADRPPASLPPEFTLAFDNDSPLRPVFPTSEKLSTDDRESPAKLRMHRVRRPDTLESLAKLYLGDSDRHMEIYHLNASSLPGGPHAPLLIGLELKIPPRREIANGPSLGSSAPQEETGLRLVPIPKK